MRQRYDDFAEWYDTYVTSGAGEGIARAADRLLAELLGRGDGRRCLDLGCGGGAHVPALTGLGWQAIGVDISVSQIALARRTCPAAAVGSADRLPLAAGIVDAGATIMTTTDFPDLRPVFAEARRVLRPGGRLVVVNVPLPVLLNAVADAGLVLQRTAEDAEDDGRPVPHLFALAATRPTRT